MSKTTSAFLFKFLMTLVFAGTASFGIIDGNAFKWVFLVGVLGTFRHIRYSNRLFNRRLAYTTTKVGNLIGAIINDVLTVIIAFGVVMAFPAFTTTTFSVMTFVGLIAVGGANTSSISTYLKQVKSNPNHIKRGLYKPLLNQHILLQNFNWSFTKRFWNFAIC